MGTTTTAISIKSRKKPNTNMTAITTINCDQKPPGKLCRKSLTYSSPPKPLNAAVSIAAPKRIMKTMEVVLEVSIITSFKVLSATKVLQVDHPIAATNIIVATKANATAS